MRVVMVGAGDHPPTFIDRLIAAVREHGVEVASLPEPTQWKRATRALLRRNITAHLPSAIRDQVRSADVLHYQWPAHHQLWGALARNYHKPSLLSLRGRQANVLPHLPGRASTRAALTRAFAEVEGVHAVSAQILDEASRLGLHARRSWIIRPSVDTTFFSPAAVQLPSEPLQLLMVGALTWVKGYEDALLALRGLLDLGIRAALRIVGDGVDREHIEYSIADLGLSAHVELLGALQPGRVLRLLRESHALLLTSLSEGIANAAIEAMACGIPVVSTDAGGMREAISDGVEGFIVPRRSPAETCLRLKELALHPALRAAMGARGRARAVEQFDVRQQGRQFVAIYEALAR